MFDIQYQVMAKKVPCLLVAKKLLTEIGYFHFQLGLFFVSSPFTFQPVVVMRRHAICDCSPDSKRFKIVLTSLSASELY